MGWSTTGLAPLRSADGTDVIKATAVLLQEARSSGKCGAICARAHFHAQDRQRFSTLGPGC